MRFTEDYDGYTLITGCSDADRNIANGRYNLKDLAIVLDLNGGGKTTAFRARPAGMT